jgi:hypothetical protein
MNWDRLLDPGVIALLIPIFAIIGWIVVIVLKHRERMAMIEAGMNPDAPEEARKQADASRQSQP